MNIVTECKRKALDYHAKAQAATKAAENLKGDEQKRMLQRAVSYGRMSYAIANYLRTVWNIHPRRAA